MNAERARLLLLSLPHVAETQQWGDNLVYWVGDKAIGGKMFCLLDLSSGVHGVASFAAGPERFAELVEAEGLRPAPYLARAYWVAAERWDALREREWEAEFRAAHAVVFARLPPRTRDVLALPARERNALVGERRKLLAARGEAGKRDALKAGASPKKRRTTNAATPQQPR